MCIAPATCVYPHLRAFLGAWFHQDFDLDGETLEDIVARYREVSPRFEIDATRGDIDKFIEAHGDSAHKAFVENFDPDVDPSGWGMSTRDWLFQIRQLLQ